MTITCRACGHHLDPADATAQAGPAVSYYYCRDTDACRERLREEARAWR